MSFNHCPLCSSKNTQLYHTDNTREYHKCWACDFIFVPVVFHLSEVAEKSRYDLHNNDSHDANYRQFLSQVANPLLERHPKEARGLDFGCGPGPTLSVMLKEKGCKVDLYDKFYAKNDEVFTRQYDFITATEVVEHLRNPAFEIKRLIGLLKPQSMLFLMTEMLSDNTKFADWYYKNDPSHVGFFSQKTFANLAKRWQLKLTIISDRVVILQR